MISHSLEETLKTLTYYQASVLYWTCEGWSNENIAARYNYTKSWVVYQMSFVYHKLGIDRIDQKTGKKPHWTERRTFLQEKVCPILRRLINDDPERLEIFPIIPPNVYEGDLIYIPPGTPEAEIPPPEITIPRLEPQAEPPQLPEPGEIPPPEPPPDFYPIQLYNAWLAVLEDDSRKGQDNPPPPPPQPIFIQPERRGIMWGRILALLSAVILGCGVVGVLAYWFGTRQNPPPSTPIPGVTQEIPVTETLAQTVQATFTAPVTETPAPTSEATSTLTITPLPTDTKSPIGLQKGDELRDDRVTLRFTDFAFYEGYDRIARKVAAISYRFEFTNHSGGPIVFRVDGSNFRVTDDLGIEYPCVFEDGVYITPELDKPVENGSTLPILLRCGPNQELGDDVNEVTLSVSGSRDLIESTWIVAP
jgi:hypothetical protein